MTVAKGCETHDAKIILVEDSPGDRMPRKGLGADEEAIIAFRDG